jgi:hypothetical protein
MELIQISTASLVLNLLNECMVSTARVHPVLHRLGESPGDSDCGTILIPLGQSGLKASYPINSLRVHWDVCVERSLLGNRLLVMFAGSKMSSLAILILVVTFCPGVNSIPLRQRVVRPSISSELFMGHTQNHWNSEEQNLA